MSNFTNLLAIEEAPPFLNWNKVGFKDASEFMLDRLGLAVRANKLELYILNDNSDFIIWAIGRQLDV